MWWHNSTLLASYIAFPLTGVSNTKERCLELVTVTQWQPGVLRPGACAWDGDAIFVLPLPSGTTG